MYQTLDRESVIRARSVEDLRNSPPKTALILQSRALPAAVKIVDEGANKVGSTDSRHE